MAIPIFLDTNILVYAYDSREPEKQKIARRILREAVLNGTGVVSTQVLQEFCNVMLRQKPPFIRETDLAEVVRVSIAPILRHKPSLDFYLHAVQLFAINSLNFYDALIVQAAIELGCQELYSEDLQAGHKYGNLEIVNPFGSV